MPPSKATARRSRTRHWLVRLCRAPALVPPEGEAVVLERRAAALLALVALEPGITRRQAAALLWPESDDPTARQALRQQLLRLKRATGFEVVVGQDVLQLGPSIATDAHEADAGSLLGDFDYTGEDALDRWVRRHRDARQRAQSERLKSALASAEAAADHAAAIARAGELVALDPDHEPHHRALMRAHYLAGDLARATNAYEALRRMLEREFGAKPSVETEQLARTLRSALAPSGTAALREAPSSILRPPRLIGRDRELAALQRAWTEGRTCAVAGVAGLGKTRLLDEATRAQPCIAAAQGRPGDALVPYSLLARLLRRVLATGTTPLPEGTRHELAALLPELGAAPPVKDKATTTRLVAAADDLVDRAVPAGLRGFVIDDLHHADPASLDALRVLLCRDGTLPVLVAYRGDEVPPSGRELVEALLSRGGDRIALEAFTPAQVAELLESLDLPGFDAARHAPEIARHTGGNPLFVLETVKAMLAQPSPAGSHLPVAGSIAVLIERRLARLSPAALRLARCAAIAGREFDAALASRVLAVQPLDLADAWAELEASQVFGDGGFAHDLIHEAALASVPRALARRMHAEVAAVLEGAGADAARIASHWDAAREPAKAAAAFRKAAGEARAMGRRHEEAMLLGHAARGLQECRDAHGAFEALIERADALVFDDLGEATREAVLEAEAAAGSEPERLRALLCKAEYLSIRSDCEECVAVAQEGLRLARRLRDARMTMRLAVVLAGAWSELRQVARALELLLPMRSELGPAVDARTTVEFLIQLGISLDLANRLVEALGSFEQARELATREGFRDLLATALSNLATTTSKHGGLTRAVDYGRQALQLARESEPLKGMPMQTQTLLAHRLRDIGHYAEAIAMLEEALAEFRRTQTRYWEFAAAHRLALAYSHLGQHARAANLLQPEPDGLPVRMQAIWLAHRAEVRRLGGGDAQQPVRAALACLGEDVDDGNNRFVSLIAASIVPPAEGEALAAAVAAWAQARERFGMAVAAHLRAADCARRAGAIDRAEPQVEAALRLFDTFEPDNFYRAKAWWVAHQVFAAAGRAEQARQMLRRGREWVLEVAERHVPREYRESFLKRNSVNRDLLAAAARER